MGTEGRGKRGRGTCNGSEEGAATARDRSLDHMKEKAAAGNKGWRYRVWSQDVLGRQAGGQASRLPRVSYSAHPALRTQNLDQDHHNR